MGQNNKQIIPNKYKKISDIDLFWKIYKLIKVMFYLSILKLFGVKTLYCRVIRHNIKHLYYVSKKLDMKRSYELILFCAILLFSSAHIANAQFGSLTLLDPENFEDLEPLLPGVEYSIVLKYDALSTVDADIVDPNTIDLTVIPAGGIVVISGPTLNEDGCTITTTFTPLVNDVEILICADDDSPFTQGSKAIFRTGALSVPVLFSSIHGAQQNKEVNIIWTTDIEVGNEKFEIERAFADSEFTSIGELKGAGNNIRKSSYSFIDLNPKSGVNAYRIKQTDFNGQSAYSETVRVIYFSEKDIQLTPNPASKALDNPMLYIHSDSPKRVNVQLFNLIGKSISDNEYVVLEGQNRFAIPTEELSEGLYLVRIDLGTHKLTKKLFLEK